MTGYYLERVVKVQFVPMFCITTHLCAMHIIFKKAKRLVSSETRKDCIHIADIGIENIESAKRSFL